jgi:D-alanyl-lipoteichoic acid acyltransferase DltB (MBOAT superfamily)
VLFSSITFLFFFPPASIVIYFLTPSTLLKNLVLLALSLLFYAWGEPIFVLAMVGAILVNFVAAWVMDLLSGRKRQIALVIAIAIDLCLLGLFKYADFAVLTLDKATQPMGLKLLAPGLPLPLGISFFTFHGLSYLIDVYRRRFADRGGEEFEEAELGALAGGGDDQRERRAGRDRREVVHGSAGCFARSISIICDPTRKLGSRLNQTQ